MSNRNAIASLVQKKMQVARARVSTETSSISDALEQAGAKAQILGDYQLYFQGSHEALEAIGLTEDELRPVVLAEKAIQADIDAEKNRALLEEELRNQG